MTKKQMQALAMFAKRVSKRYPAGNSEKADNRAVLLIAKKVQKEEKALMKRLAEN